VCGGGGGGDDNGAEDRTQVRRVSVFRVGVGVSVFGVDTHVAQLTLEGAGEHIQGLFSSSLGTQTPPPHTTTPAPPSDPPPSPAQLQWVPDVLPPPAHIHTGQLGGSQLQAIHRPEVGSNTHTAALL
jgi:hypothetical protein